MRRFRPKLKKETREQRLKKNRGTYGYGFNRRKLKDYNPKEPSEEELFTGKVRLLREKPSP